MAHHRFTHAWWISTQPQIHIALFLPVAPLPPPPKTYHTECELWKLTLPMHRRYSLVCRCHTQRRRKGKGGCVHTGPYWQGKCTQPARSADEIRRLLRCNLTDCVVHCSRYYTKFSTSLATSDLTSTKDSAEAPDISRSLSAPKTPV